MTAEIETVPRKMFLIDDTEKHWVIAETYDEALQLFYQEMDYTQESYLKEHGEMPQVFVCVVPVVVNLDGPPTAGDFARYPNGTRFSATIPVSAFGSMEKGLVCSTVF